MCGSSRFAACWWCDPVAILTSSSIFHMSLVPDQSGENRSKLSYCILWNLNYVLLRYLYVSRPIVKPNSDSIFSTSITPRESCVVHRNFDDHRRLSTAPVMGSRRRKAGDGQHSQCHGVNHSFSPQASGDRSFTDTPSISSENSSPVFHMLRSKRRRE